MKIDNVDLSNQKAGSGDAFTIAATGKAFKILSDGLYSDKIMSIIRELSCNAYDSHVAAGKPDLPFEIHLPTTDEKWFSVTDFGTGISDTDIYSIYTRYFASTKTSSNEFIGQLGLGSKSPFSYTREFKVRSRVDGIEKTYRMYFDDTDTPRVESLYEKDCNLSGLPKSGLEVSFDVNDNDIRRFKDRAIDVLSWFKVPPTITGVSGLKIETVVSNLTSGRWMIRNKQGYGSMPPVALMGNVAYPIDPDNIEGLSPLYQNLLGIPVVIEFNIGDLEVSASRESLGYDKKTQSNIVSRCQAVIDDLRAQYDNKIKSFQTKWEARRFYDQNLGNGAEYRWQMRELFKDVKLTWTDGTVIDSMYSKLDLTKIYDLSKHGYRVHSGAHGKPILNRVHKDLLSAFEQPCGNRYLIVFNDCERGGLNRIKHWAKTELTDGGFTVYDKPDSITWDELKNLLGNPPVRMSSEMTAPVKTKIAKATMMIYDGSDYNRHRWKDAAVDMTQGGFWIMATNKEPIGPNGARVDIKNILTSARNLKLIPDNAIVYAPKGAMRNKIHNTKGWVNIIDFLVQKVKSGWRADLVDAMATAIAWNEQLRKVGCAEMRYGEWNLRDKSSLMQDVVNINMEMSSLSSSLEYQHMSTMRNLANMLGITLPSGNADTEKLKNLDQIPQRYPLLRIFDYRQWRDNFHHIVEYVNMVDANYVFYALSAPDLNQNDDG